MKSLLIRASLVVFAVLSFNQLALADNDSASKAIAGILVNLNHFPSDAEKVVLMEIANDESNGRGFRAIATAVHNMQHAASAEDKEIMGNIMAAEQADPRARALAEIVAGISHMPSAEAKATLQAML